MPLPSQVPVLTRPLPERINSLFWEKIDRPATGIFTKDYGEAHPDTVNFPGYLLCWIEPVDHVTAKAWYAAEHVVQDPWNAGITYGADSNAHPIYDRRYILRRDNAPVLAKGSTFSGVWFIEVTNPGSGYVYNGAAPLVIISGGAGIGATARALVEPNGSLSWIVITAEGSGYTSAPAVAIASPSVGVAATAVAHVQAVGVVLTREEQAELPEGDPRRSLFVMVARRYEMLPGPYVPFTRYDDNLGPIQGRRRDVINTGQAASLATTFKRTYEGRDGSSYVSVELEENWSDGTGSPGNPLYPILIRDIYDDQRGPLQQVSQIVVKTEPQVGSITLAGGIFTQISYEPFNEFLSKRVTETWAIPTPPLGGKTMSDEAQGSLVDTTSQIIDQDAAAYAPDWKTLSYRDSPVNAELKQREVTTLPDANFPVLTEYLRDPEMNSLITLTYQVVNAATVAALVAAYNPATADLGYSEEFRRMDRWRSLRVTTIYSTPIAYSEQRFMGFRFESMFFEFLEVPSCGQFINMIEGRTANVACRTDISFGAKEEVIGQKIFTNTIRLFDVNLTDILNDGLCYQSSGTCVTSGSGINVPSSYPTAMQYLALFNNAYQLITGESVLWKNRMYRTSKLYVQFPTIPAPVSLGSCVP